MEIKKLHIVLKALCQHLCSKNVLMLTSGQGQDDSEEQPQQQQLHDDVVTVKNPDDKRQSYK